VLLRHDLFAKYLQPQTVHQHRSTKLAAIFLGMLTSLSAATRWKYESNRRYGIWIEIVHICEHKDTHRKASSLHSPYPMHEQHTSL